MEIPPENEIPAFLDFTCKLKTEIIMLIIHYAKIIN